MANLISDAQTAAPKLFRNPNFDSFWSGPANGVVFDGIMTVGDGLQANQSLKAIVWRQSDEILVSAEINALELEQINVELSRTNQKINNLQRELIKKNRLLEDSLSKLRDTQSMLCHAEKMNALGQLIAGISHEINTPLCFVAGNIQLLREWTPLLLGDDPSNDQTERSTFNSDLVGADTEATESKSIKQELPALLEATESGLSQVKQLIEKLHIFSRHNRAIRGTVNLNHQLQATLDLIAQQIRQQHVEVKLQLADLPKVDCYPAELNQVFLNLIINALQAMPEAGVLEIKSRETEQQQVEVVVKDNGEGIDNEVIKRIFEPFFTTKPIGSGTGLGLSIAHEIVTHHHRGSLTVHSIPRSGTEFIMQIPICMG
jgi:signal transduction histidine kinase